MFQVSLLSLLIPGLVPSHIGLEAGFLHATKTRAEDLNTPECTAISKCMIAKWVYIKLKMRIAGDLGMMYILHYLYLINA